MDIVNQSLSLALLGEFLDKCRVIRAEVWRAAMAQAHVDESGCDLMPVLEVLNGLPAWWSAGLEPAVSSYQAKALKAAIKRNALPAVHWFRLSDYLLLDEIGTGGMARVYRAWDLKNRRIVALKRVHYATRDHRLRFRRETKILRMLTGLNHPSINRFYGCHALKGAALVAVEYVPGKDLARIVAERGPLPWREACNYTVQIVEALMYAHGQGVLHRDVKPHNFMLAEKSGQVVLLDFGLSKVRSLTQEAAADDPDDQTRGAQRIGTPAYMSPEHWEGSERVAEASDVYSLGCSLFELLVGRAPFKGASSHLTAHLSMARPSVKTCREKSRHPEPVPERLDLLVRQMMSIRPADRGSLTMIRDQLAALLRSPEPRIARDRKEERGEAGRDVDDSVETSRAGSSVLDELIGEDGTPSWIWMTVLWVTTFPWLPAALFAGGGLTTLLCILRFFSAGR